jgi:hypothetical protein
LDALIKGIAVLTLLIFIPLFLILTVAVRRMGFAVVLTMIRFFIWAIFASLIAGGIAGVIAFLFGNEFEAQRGAVLLEEVNSVALPAAPPPRPSQESQPCTV